MTPNPMLWACTALSMLIFSTPAPAATSDWEDLGGGKARLVAVLDPADGTISAMVEIDLEKGWKTYWREPGGSGIPPQFDFSGSKNFLPQEVRFPVPQLLSAGGASFPGYQEHVGFPFSGTATSMSPDGELHVNLFIGVCEEICIPATAQLSISMADLMVSDARSALAIETAMASLPQPQSPAFSITHVEISSPEELRVSATVPATDEEIALFAEGPDGWYLPPAKLTSKEDHEAVFLLSVAEKPEGGDVAETKLRYTLVNGEAGIEQWLTIEE